MCLCVFVRVAGWGITFFKNSVFFFRSLCFVSASHYLNVADPHPSLHVVADHEIPQNAVGGDLGLLDDVGAEGDLADAVFLRDGGGDGKLELGWRETETGSVFVSNNIILLSVLIRPRFTTVNTRMQAQTWALGGVGAGGPPVAERQHLEVRDGRVVHDGDVQAEAADQLQRPQAGHVLVATQPPPQELLVGQQEHGPVPTRDAGRHPEHLHLLGTGGGKRDFSGRTRAG